MDSQLSDFIVIDAISFSVFCFLIAIGAYKFIMVVQSMLMLGFA